MNKIPCGNTASTVLHDGSALSAFFLPLGNVPLGHLKAELRSIHLYIPGLLHSTSLVNIFNECFLTSSLRMCSTTDFEQDFEPISWKAL